MIAIAIAIQNALLWWALNSQPEYGPPSTANLPSNLAFFSPAPTTGLPIWPIGITFVCAVGIVIATQSIRRPGAWLIVAGMTILTVGVGFGRPWAGSPRGTGTITCGLGGANPCTAASGGLYSDYLITLHPDISIPWMGLGGILLALGALSCWIAAESDRGFHRRILLSAFLAMSAVDLLVLFVGFSAVTYNAHTTIVFGRPIRRGRKTLNPLARTMSRPTASRAGEVWEANAYHEAASVVAFLELRQRLINVGAPNRLVHGCAIAAGDEARHAQVCTRLAIRFGLPETPIVQSTARPSISPRSLTGIKRRTEILRLASESITDGVIGERFSAAQIKRGSETVSDDWAKDALARVASDEARHAELAESIVEWCRDQLPRPVIAVSQWHQRQLPSAPPERDDIRGLTDAERTKIGLTTTCDDYRLWQEVCRTALPRHPRSKAS